MTAIIANQPNILPSHLTDLRGADRPMVVRHGAEIDPPPVQGVRLVRTSIGEAFGRSIDRPPLYPDDLVSEARAAMGRVWSDSLSFSFTSPTATPAISVNEPPPLAYGWDEVDALNEDDMAWLDNPPLVPLPKPSHTTTMHFTRATEEPPPLPYRWDDEFLGEGKDPEGA